MSAVSVSRMSPSKSNMRARIMGVVAGDFFVAPGPMQALTVLAPAHDPPTRPPRLTRLRPPAQGGRLVHEGPLAGGLPGGGPRQADAGRAREAGPARPRPADRGGRQGQGGDHEERLPHGARPGAG